MGAAWQPIISGLDSKGATSSCSISSKNPWLMRNGGLVGKMRMFLYECSLLGF